MRCRYGGRAFPRGTGVINTTQQFFKGSDIFLPRWRLLDLAQKVHWALISSLPGAQSKMGLVLYIYSLGLFLVRRTLNENKQGKARAHCKGRGCESKIENYWRREYAKC